MKYMGSKSRHAKEIIPFLVKEFKEGMSYIEPFVGGGNMIDKVPFPVRTGYDISKDAIDALISIRDGVDTLPKNKLEFTEADYKSARNDDKYLNRGYISIALSYGGKVWGGWRRDKEGLRDYVREAYDNAVKQSKNLQGVGLSVRSVFDLQIKDESLIYCDPPYRDTTKYTGTFDHDRFYDWCREKKEEGHIVFVSEYWMPSDFTCVWRKEVNSSLTKDTGSRKAVEKLYLLK